MRIAITGGAGFIGTPLSARLRAEGHSVVPISRRPLPGGVPWDPDKGKLDGSALAGIDGVIHLAGESISGGRWSVKRKARIRDSRVRGTDLLAGTIAMLRPLPSFFVGASAIGIYGDRGDEELDESSPPGKGFLAEVAREWEGAAEPARAAGIRTTHLRMGLVLDPQGGALGEMLLPFRLGLGGPLGSGRQFWSWITLDDVVSAFVHLVGNGSISGPVNGVTASVTNAEFTRTLNRVLGRWTAPAVPGFLLRLLLGEMADALLLSSARVLPARLNDSGFRPRDPELEPALARLLAAQSSTE